MPLAPISGGGSTNPIEFKQKVTTNVEHVIGRINGIAPQYFSEEVKPLPPILLCGEFLVQKGENEGMEWRMGMFPFLSLDVQGGRRDEK